MIDAASFDDFYCIFISASNCSQACFFLKHDGTYILCNIYLIHQIKLLLLLLLDFVDVGAYSKFSRIAPRPKNECCRDSNLLIVLLFSYILPFHLLFAYKRNSKNVVICFNFNVCQQKTTITIVLAKHFPLFRWRICYISKLLHFLNAFFSSSLFSISLDCTLMTMKMNANGFRLIWFLHISIRYAKEKLNHGNFFFCFLLFLHCITLRLFYQIAKILTHRKWSEWKYFMNWFTVWASSFDSLWIRFANANGCDF